MILNHSVIRNLTLFMTINVKHASIYVFYIAQKRKWDTIETKKKNTLTTKQLKKRAQSYWIINNNRRKPIWLLPKTFMNNTTKSTFMTRILTPIIRLLPNLFLICYDNQRKWTNRYRTHMRRAMLWIAHTSLSYVAEAVETFKENTSKLMP